MGWEVRPSQEFTQRTTLRIEVSDTSNVMPSLSEGGDVQEGDFLLMAKGRFVGQFDLDHKIHEHRARDNFKTKKM